MGLANGLEMRDRSRVSRDVRPRGGSLELRDCVAILRQAMPNFSLSRLGSWKSHGININVRFSAAADPANVGLEATVWRVYVGLEFRDFLRQINENFAH
jgi:hypothetical protein